MTEKKKKKKIAAILIVAVAFLISGFLVFDAAKNDGEFLKLVRGGLDDYRFAFSSDAQYRNVLEGDNSTDRFIQNYGSEIALKNPSGPSDGTLTLPSQEVFDKLLAKEISAGISYEEISEKDIRTVPDSKENFASYLSAARSAIRMHRTDLWKSLFELSEKGDAKPLLAYVAESDAVAKKLLVTPVPSSWKNFHIDFINFERKRIEVVRAIAASDEDPVKGIAAMEELTNLNETELKLAEDFAEKTEGI